VEGFQETPDSLPPSKESLSDAASENSVDSKETSEPGMKQSTSEGKSWQFNYSHYLLL
jgi:hypothetical protein